MVKHDTNECLQEVRLIRIEQEIRTKNAFLDDVRQDLKKTIEQGNKLSLQVAELNKILMLREDAFIQLDTINNEVITLTSIISTIKWTMPALCAFISVAITLASFIITHLK